MKRRGAGLAVLMALLGSAAPAQTRDGAQTRDALAPGDHHSGAGRIQIGGSRWLSLQTNDMARERGLGHVIKPGVAVMHAEQGGARRIVSPVGVVVRFGDLVEAGSACRAG